MIKIKYLKKKEFYYIFYIKILNALKNGSLRDKRYLFLLIVNIVIHLQYFSLL